MSTPALPCNLPRAGVVSPLVARSCPVWFELAPTNVPTAGVPSILAEAKPAT